MKNKDPNSAANFYDVIIRHIQLKWEISFKNERITGIATYEAEFVSDTDCVIFDSRDLTVKSVQSPCDATFSIADNKMLGQKIIIQLGRIYKKDEKLNFFIEYETSPKASALQFVGAEFTNDKISPFLYSQCQAIHARSIVPCMDTPRVKQTYSASITIPSGMVCLMSALSVRNTKSSDESSVTFEFTQPIAIPSYLIAIVVGALERREISERCAIWAEPSLIDSAKDEFCETEKMLNAAENLMGEYVWKRYDMVVLPPFFPYGGMENPMLTFLTPTIIAGDRSMANVIAHEICHSWTGNLVTNASWECFWLNEGFTNFMENKVMGILHGEQFRQFRHYCNWHDDLKSVVYKVFSPTHEYTKLMPNLYGVDPDDYFSKIPYVKGASFLLLLEQKLGGAEIFNQFMRSYIAKFAQKSITVSDFLGYLREYFKDKTAVLDEIPIDKWLNEPGMPPQEPTFDTTLIAKCQLLAKKWIESSVEELRCTNADDFLNLHPDEQINVLSTLDRKVDLLSVEKVALMNEMYNISEIRSCDVRAAWIILGLLCKYRPIIPIALDFVKRYGRLKYLKPTYKYLFSWDETREIAIKQFNENKSTMHPISVYIVNSLLK